MLSSPELFILWQALLTFPLGLKFVTKIIGTYLHHFPQPFMLRIHISPGFVCVHLIPLLMVVQFILFCYPNQYWNLFYRWCHMFGFQGFQVLKHLMPIFWNKTHIYILCTLLIGGSISLTIVRVLIVDVEFSSHYMVFHYWSQQFQELPLLIWSCPPYYCEYVRLYVFSLFIDNDFDFHIMYSPGVRRV